MKPQCRHCFYLFRKFVGPPYTYYLCSFLRRLVTLGRPACQTFKPKEKTP